MFLVVAIAQQRSDGTITPTTSGSGIEGATITANGSMPNELFRVYRATPSRRLPAPYFMTKLTKLSVDPTRGLQASTIR